MPPVDLARARRAKAQLLSLLAGSEHVVGVGLTKRGDDYALKVNLRGAAGARQVPPSVDGVPVVSEVVGAIRKR